MKYVILRYEDQVRAGHEVVPLLEGAKTAHLESLAQAGAAGLIYRRAGGPPINRFELHRALFGLSPDDRDAIPGPCYAAGANVRLAKGETAWCCELVTQRDGAIIDPTAGGIPTTESEVLIRALNGELGSEARRWEIGHGSHHVLVAQDPALEAGHHAAVPPPEVLLGSAWSRSLPRDSRREPLERLITEASQLLESHPVNRVRIDLGENPANLLWLWGGGQDGPQHTFAERTGLSGAVVSSTFPMRGFADRLGLDYRSGPTSMQEGAFHQLLKGLTALLDRRDLVYVHLRVESADPVERLCAMERVDQLVLKPLTEWLPRQGPWRLLSVIDDCASGSAACIGIGTGLPQHPVAHVDGQSLAQSAFAFEDGLALFSWFTTL